MVKYGRGKTMEKEENPKVEVDLPDVGDTPKEAETGNSKPDGIIRIPVEKIKEFRWSTGIRDQKKYDLLKQNIKEHGLNNPIKVRPLKDGYFEPFIGDHRVRIAKERAWKEIPCIVEDISVEKALEICVSDNVCRQDYSCVELENKINELWTSQRYNSREDLGKAVGLSDVRIGQLLFAKEIREKSEGTLTEKISTQAILDTKPLKSDNDKIALLDLVVKGKFKPSEIRSKAKSLSALDEDKRNQVLYHGTDLNKIKKEVNDEINKNTPKGKKSSKTKEESDITPKLYELCKQVGNQIALMETGDRENAVEYIKVCSGLMLETLTKNDELNERTFDTFVKEALKIDVNVLRSYDGTSVHGIGWYF
jgi:ParB family chromosome partitioning protein